MLWEQNSTIIVMLTKLREMGRVRPLTSSFRSARSVSADFVLFDIELDYCLALEGVGILSVVSVMKRSLRTGRKKILKLLSNRNLGFN